MKKVLLLILSITLTLSAYAQEAHLKFKGIPVDGNYKEFAQKLVQKGFRQIEISEDGVALKGNFMATPDVLVVVYPDPKSKVVSNVSAMIDAGDKWPDIENKYRSIVATYTEKYGVPTEHVEEFTVDVHNDDYWRKDALRNSQCNYKSQWEVEGGRIVIALAFFQRNFYVINSYIDDQNIKALRQTILEDI